MTRVVCMPDGSDSCSSSDWTRNDVRMTRVAVLLCNLKRIYLFIFVTVRKLRISVFWKRMGRERERERENGVESCM